MQKLTTKYKTETISLSYCGAKELRGILDDAMEQYGEDNVFVEVQEEYGTTTPILECRRAYTPQEEEDEARRVEENKLWRRKHYEALKKEFEE